MLVLSSQARLLGSNPVVPLCDQEPVRTFQKGPPPEKAKLRRWWTYLSQLRLTVHHIQGVKNECADYVSRNNFDALIGARSEALAKEALSVMGLPLAAHVLIFARSKWQISDARTAQLRFSYLENISWMLCLLVVLAGTTSLLNNCLDLHDEDQDFGFKYFAFAVLSTRVPQQ